MKTLEEKEKEFLGYVVKQLEAIPQIHFNYEAMDRARRNTAHNLIQDFKEEIEGFNLAMNEELEQTKEELERYKEAFEVYYKAIHGD